MQIVQMPQEATVVTFDDFWNMYPRRVAKKDARKAWERIPTKLHAEILTALFEWSRIWNARGEVQYIPYPATWLNGERWEDDFPPGHRPYTPQQRREEVKVDNEPRKPMPPHIAEALRKLRAA